jgi:hypothetical protein
MLSMRQSYKQYLFVWRTGGDNNGLSKKNPASGAGFFVAVGGLVFIDVEVIVVFLQRKIFFAG